MAARIMGTLVLGGITLGIVLFVMDMLDKFLSRALP